MSYHITQDEAMRRTWCRVTSSGQYACGPVCRTEDVYDAILLIVYLDGSYVVMKNAYDPRAAILGSPTFLLEEARAAKYVADFITTRLRRSATP